MLGGSSAHTGGVEAFCDRASAALARDGHWQVTRIMTSSAYLSLGTLALYLRGIAALIGQRRDRPDCIWLHYVNLPDLAYLIVARLLGMRVMVTPHLGSNWKSQSSPVLRRLSGWALRHASRFALLSATQEGELNLPASVPRSRIITFLPAEMLAARPDPLAKDPAQLRLIHASRLSEGKGSFLVVDVCAALRDAGLVFSAEIVGPADAVTNAALHDRIARHQLADHVTVPGPKSMPQMVVALQRSDVLIHLSRIDSYPLIVLEAMACGVVPVCLDLAGARSMVATYDGHVVGPERPVEDTAEWIAGLVIADIRRRGNDISQRVRADFDWSQCLQALDAALRECLRA